MKIGLEKHDRICFLGDSITAHGIWESEVVEYFLGNYRDLEIEFYNCGISGTQGRNAELKNRLYCDFLNYFPRYAVILFGANDVPRRLYDPDKETEERIAEREARVAEYETTLTRLTDICAKRGITPIICTPTPFDEYNDPPARPWNIDAAMKYCADTAARIAKEKRLLLIDMRDALLRRIGERPICADRLHPNDYGYHLMAERFLVGIGAKEAEEPDKAVTLSERNVRRFEIEDILRDIMAVEFDFMGWQYEAKQPPLRRRKQLLKEWIARDARDFSRLYKRYLKYADKRDELRGELLRRTFGMYE